MGAITGQANIGVARGGVFHTLDGLRGVAAALIVARHAPDLFGPLQFARSYLAVDLFFVLSGFVIASAYEGRLRSGLSALEFMRARLIRLYPLYVLGLMLGVVVTLVAVAAGQAEGWSMNAIGVAFAAGLFMLPSPVGPHGHLYPLNSPSWSLMFEIIVNAVYALIYPLLSTRALVAIVAASVPALAIAAWANNGLDAGFTWATIPAGLARVSFSFFAGALLFRLHRGRRVSAWAPWALLALGGLVLSWPAMSGVADFVTVILVFPALVWAAAKVEPGRVAAKAFRFLGLTSYAVYALHTPAARLVNGGLLLLGVPNLAPWSGLIFLALLLVGCAVLDALYDKPARNYLSAWRVRRARPA